MDPERTGTRIEKVAVVIPVHDEEQHLERALEGIQAAADVLQAGLPGVDLAIVAVLDSCTDNSAAVAAGIAAGDPRVRLVQVGYRSVGRSRRAGIKAVLTGPLMPGDPSGLPQALGQLWLANTDADSRVPGNWLLRQVVLADGGADAVVGTVEPEAEGMDIELLKRWHLRHSLAEDHSHVFGANLGVRASAYVLAGGFPRQRSDEDKVLVERLRRQGFNVTFTDSVRVRTSGRTDARAPQGFGAYLRALRMEVALEG